MAHTCTHERNAGLACRKNKENDKGLTHLFIARTNIGDAGQNYCRGTARKQHRIIWVLGEIISLTKEQSPWQGAEINRSVEWLDLSENDIGDFGAEAFLKTIKNNRNLTQLNLYENPKIHDDNLFAINYCLLDDEECKDLHSWSSEKLKDMAIAYHRDTDYHRHQDDIDEPDAVQHNEMRM